MSDISVVGLGEMGSALASALLSKGRSVTVWNRSASKASPLVTAGASLAPSIEAAVDASPAIMVCVSDYKATRDILEVAARSTSFSGKLLIQLTSGIPSEARELAEWAAQHQAEYLDGAIFAWPRQIGIDAVILTSGAPEATALAQPHIDLLGQNVSIGEEVGAASALFSGALAYLAGHWIGFAHGARVCESEGLTAEMLGETLARIAPALGEDNRHMGKVITAGDYSLPESTLRTAGTDIGRLVHQAMARGLSTEFPKFAADLFARAIEAGLGAEEHVAIAKLLGPQR